MSSLNPSERTNDELKLGLVHFAYEVKMCLLCVGLLVDAPDNVDVPSAQSPRLLAALESQLVHLRAVTEFLIRPQTDRIDDMRRDAFAPDWDPLPADAVERLNGLHDPINKRLMHLTWVRLDEPVLWESGANAEAALQVSLAWSDHLARTRPDLAEFLHSELRSVVRLPQ